MLILIPMLTYIASGSRDYYKTPARTGQRGVWEFQAVTQGTIAPVFQFNDILSFQSSTLWIFPPESIHGWAGRKGEAAEVLVFHFSIVPNELENLCRGRDSLSFKITEEEILDLKKLHAELFREYETMDELYSLKSRMAVDRLTLMACEKNANLIKRDRSTFARHIVEKSEALFRAEMHLGINLLTISEKLGVSAAHLRRIFHQVKEKSPRSALEEIRMERAAELSCRTDYSFLEIAQACGFSEQSAFTKAFCRYWKRTPSEARADGLLGVQ